MPTPFDNRLLLIHWVARTLRPTRDIFGRIDPRAGELGISIRDFCLWARREFPNLSGISIKTNQGQYWQGFSGNENSSDVRAITSLDRVRDWLRACNEANLELHVWCVPVGRPGGVNTIANEIALIARIMSVQVDGVGIKSLSLDVEAGPSYWVGTSQDAYNYMSGLRNNLAGTHIAVILDYRFRAQNRDRSRYVDPWANGADSLHPMVYPSEFFPWTNPMPIEREMRRAFTELAEFGKPIVPMAQAHDTSYSGGSNPVQRLTTAQEILDQARWAFQLGAAGVTFFRTGTDHFQSSKWPGFSAIQPPAPVPPAPPPIPEGAIVIWPTGRGYNETVYAENPPEAPMQTAQDIYGQPARYKKTVSAQGATVEYLPVLPRAGAYRVEVFIPAALANARVEYRVMDRPGQEDAEIVTPPTDQARFSNQWVALGDYDFDPTQPGAGKVSLTDIGPDSPRQTVVFGAVRWVPLPR